MSNGTLIRTNGLSRGMSPGLYAPRTAPPAPAQAPTRGTVARPSAPARGGAVDVSARRGASPSAPASRPWIFGVQWMASWRDQRPRTRDDALRHVAGPVHTLARDGRGLPRRDAHGLLSSLGLVATPLRLPTVASLAPLIERYGPVWLVRAEDGALELDARARIVVALRGDGGALSTRARWFDVPGGAPGEGTVDALSREGAGWFAVHWPRDVAVREASLGRLARSLTLGPNEFTIDEAQRLKNVFQHQLPPHCACINATKLGVSALLNDASVRAASTGTDASTWMNWMVTNNRAEAPVTFRFKDSGGSVINPGNGAQPVSLESSIWSSLESQTSTTTDPHYAVFVASLCDGYHVATLTMDRWHNRAHPIVRWSDQTGNHGPNHWEKMVGRASGHPTRFVSDSDPRGLDEYIEYAVPVFWDAFRSSHGGTAPLPIVKVWRIKKP